jgi:hypothetical protein
VIHEDAKAALREMLASTKKDCEQGRGRGQEQGQEDLVIEEEKSD